MRSFLLLSFLLLWADQATAQSRTTSPHPLSDRIVSYTMDVTLRPESNSIDGKQRLTWRNPDSVPVKELQFHMYLNAFKNKETTFMKESGGVHRGASATVKDPWGSIQISSMKMVNPTDDFRPEIPLGSNSAEDLVDRITFIQPDDGNLADETVFSIQLPREVAPGETIALEILFESRLPEIVARTGWKTADTGNPFYFVGQWFPKIAVLEVPGQRYIPEDAEKGVWNAHQFHVNSEFYADFGKYDVTMRVPESYVVGASGVQMETSTENGMKAVRFEADDVHDFAWTASPDYLEFNQQWRHVNVRALIQPAHKGQAQRHLDAAITALEKYDAWVGEYPYTSLTVVDAIGGSNGMEYPTLITAGTNYGLPTWSRFLELVIIHEFGHQYFYGLLASNEFEEAWLDEGMNSYIESRIMDETYGPGAAISLGPFKLGDIELQRLSYAKQRPSSGALVTNSWEHVGGDYGKSTYSKPATVMNTLERYWGWDMQQRFLKAYYERWRFKHPTTRDLQSIAEEVSGTDLEWFFSQFVYGTAVVDYSVDSILITDKEDDQFVSRVRVHREQDGVFPTTLRLRFDDGTTEDVLWDGAERWKDFRREGTHKIVEAYLDPDFNNLLDVNRLNNRKVAASESDNSFARLAQRRAIMIYQTLFYVLSGLF